MKKFYELHNKEVTRQHLESVLSDAKQANEASIVFRLSTLLNSNSGDKFKVVIKNYPTQLNGNSKKVNYKDALTTTGKLRKGWVFEKGVLVKLPGSKPVKKKPVKPSKKESFSFGLNAVLPDDYEFLTGLEFIAEKDDASLNAPVKPDDIYKMITEKLLKRIEKNIDSAGKPWDDSFLKNGGFLNPANFDSKQTYRGINNLILVANTEHGILDNPYFLTFNQIKKNKGRLLKGSKGMPVVYFTVLYKQRGTKLKKNSYGTYDLKKMKSYLLNKGIKQADLIKEIDEIPILKYYNVFNGADIEGIDFGLDSLTDVQKVDLGYIAQPSKGLQEERINTAELIIKNFPKNSAEIRFTKPQAFYNRLEDYVNMPAYESFKSSPDYYRVLFHEMTHSTGHVTRLNRVFGNEFGDISYAKEEIVAEFGATFLSAYTGILWKNVNNHAGYIKNWRKALEHIEKDNRLLMRCATKGQKATDLLLDVSASGKPAFYKYLLEDNAEVKEPVKKSPPKKKEKTGQQLEFALAGKSPVFEKLTDARKYYVNWAYENLREKKIYNKEIGKTIIFNRKGIRHSLSYKTNMSKIKLITQAEAMLKKSVLIRFEADKKKRAEIKGVYRMATTAVIEGKETEVLLTLREGLNGVIYYNHEIEGIKKLRSTALGEKTPIVKCSNEVSTDKPQNKDSKKNDIITKKGLGTPVINTNSLAYKLQNQEDKVFDCFDITDAEIASLLGNLEIKETHSVVITLSGQEGSAKTRFLFRLMNATGKNYKTGHASIEEHPDSKLYWDKVHEYISSDSLNNIDAPEVTNITELDTLIRNNDIIAIDSFAKLKEMDKSFEVDTHLRKKYHGKLFVVIFQETSDGSMRGGTKSQYDGDVILHTVKDEDYKNNYVYSSKNRYQDKSLSDLKYNVYQGKMINTTTD